MRGACRMKGRNVNLRCRHHRMAASSIILYLCIVALSSNDDEPSIIPTAFSFERQSMQRSRIYWRRRSRLLSDALVLRGGIDEDMEEEAKDPTHTSDQQVDTDVIDNATNSNSTVHNEQSAASSSPSDVSATSDSKTSREKAIGGGGIVTSVVSWFRGPAVASNDESSTKTTTQRDYADKIPHGTDGRGGGGTVMSSSSSTRVDENNQDSKFLITSDVSIEDGLSELNKSTPPKKEAPKSADKGTAFVVPHHSKHHRAEQSGHDDVAKSKSSKVKDGADLSPSYESLREATNVSKTTANETESINTNLTLTQNITSQTSQSNESVIVDDHSFGGSRQDYVSSGYWVPIDILSSFGLSTLNNDLKISRILRPVRKTVANITGLHGFVSGKIYTTTNSSHQVITRRKNVVVISIDEELGIHDAGALEAEILARRVARQRRRGYQRTNSSGNRVGRRWGFRRGQQTTAARKNTGSSEYSSEYVVITSLDSSPDALEQRRRKRVEEIDHLLQRGSERLLELQCERDDLLQAPNPLFNYTKKYDPSTNQTFGDVRTSREFNFPPSSLVNEYISELVSNARLIPMNHTQLWSAKSDSIDDDDESIGDDLLTPSADARKLYENLDQLERGKVRRNGNGGGGGGSWLLRTGFGRNGGSLGEKLGETIETAAYKGVCSAVMMVLARLLSSLHGVNIMSHSDIRVYIEQDPDLPPVNKQLGENYAEETLKRAIRKGSKKKKKRHSSHRSSTRQHGYELSDDAFIQRDAVVETLISHCQISAPLLKLFPLDWQRAMVGNIITLVTAIVSDFADGLQVQILGHALSVSFKPITEADMFQQIGVGGFRQNHRRSRPDEFEAAVMATAHDISESLTFLDGWLEWAERKVGGGVLRSQIGNLIARVVLTLVDEVLSGAKLDLWSSQANGPRLYAALEYRDQSETQPSDE
ncbi:hypothetical protein ACHAXM_010228 [Skeletonema potamos]